MEIACVQQLGRHNGPALYSGSPLSQCHPTLLCERYAYCAKFFCALTMLSRTRCTYSAQPSSAVQQPQVNSRPVASGNIQMPGTALTEHVQGRLFNTLQILPAHELPDERCESICSGPISLWVGVANAASWEVAHRFWQLEEGHVADTSRLEAGKCSLEVCGVALVLLWHQQIIVLPSIQRGRVIG